MSNRNTESDDLYIQRIFRPVSSRKFSTKHGARFKIFNKSECFTTTDINRNLIFLMIQIVYLFLQ